MQAPTSVDPAAFRRWHLGSSDVVHDWSDASASVCHLHTPRGHRLVVLAQPDADGPAVAEATTRALARLRASGLRRLRLAVPPEVQPDVAAATGAVEWSRWEWMHLQTPPPCSVTRTQVRWLDDTDLPDVTRLLAEHSPRSHAAPGDPDVRGWAGIRDSGGALTCAGAVVESPAGFPHLRAITTHTSLRGRGLGTAVTSFLSAASLATSSVVTLSLYSDNAIARGLYERLGYRLGAAFASTTVTS